MAGAAWAEWPEVDHSPEKRSGRYLLQLWQGPRQEQRESSVLGEADCERAGWLLRPRLSWVSGPGRMSLALKGRGPRGCESCCLLPCRAGHAVAGTAGEGGQDILSLSWSGNPCSSQEESSPSCARLACPVCGVRRAGHCPCLPGLPACCPQSWSEALHCGVAPTLAWGMVGAVALCSWALGGLSGWGGRLYWRRAQGSRSQPPNWPGPPAANRGRLGGGCPQVPCPSCQARSPWDHSSLLRLLPP